MKKFEVEITGASPLLMHAMKTDLTENKEKSGASKTNEVEDCTYRLPDGTLYLPANALYVGLIKAGGNFPVRGKGKKTYSTLFAGALSIFPDAIPLSPQEFVVDERTVVIPATKGRTLRRRPMFPKWKASFELDVSSESIPDDVVKKSLDYLGSFIGVLDYRPEKKGPFGRFFITRFSEVQTDEKQ